MAANRTRGIRQPIPGGTVLARVGAGKGPPVPVKITALLQTGGGAAFVRGHQTDNTINGIPVKATPAPNNKDLLQYILANGDWEYKSLTQVIDGLGATQGDILYRNATAWVILPPGTSGQFLKTNGAVANPAWADGNAGTVTSVATGTGLTGGPITGSGTISLAPIADHDLLANTSGGAAAPIPTTLTALIDNAIGAVQGDILYRNATVWTILAPGTSGQVLQTGGASANPSWVTPSGGGGGGMLPLVNGDLPGPIAIADGRGQYIGVPI